MYVSHTQEVQRPSLYFIWLFAIKQNKRKKSKKKKKGGNTIQMLKHGLKTAVKNRLLVLEVFSKAWTNPVGDVKSSFPVVGGDLSSHVPIEG